MNVPLNCNPWPEVPSTNVVLGQEVCLKAFLNAGFFPFTGSGAMVGAVSPFGCVTIIYRGRSVYWELELKRDGKSVQILFTCDLVATSTASILWLGGSDLGDALKAVRSFIVERPGMKPNCTEANETQ